jgi:hypothetical protein
MRTYTLSALRYLELMPEMRRVGNPTCSQTLKIVFSRQRALFLELGLELGVKNKKPTLLSN